MNQGLRPTFHAVPAEFKTINSAFIEVEQEEWDYQYGNDKQDLKFEDCRAWEDFVRMAKKCPNKCLPVNLQFLWKESVDRPRCNNGSDHSCMVEVFLNPVCFKDNFVDPLMSLFSIVLQKMLTANFSPKKFLKKDRQRNRNQNMYTSLMELKFAEAVCQDVFS